MNIDWTKPLEAYHADGTITPISLRGHGFCKGPNPDNEGDYWTAETEPQSLPSVWSVMGEGDSGWNLRNVGDAA